MKMSLNMLFNSCTITQINIKKLEHIPAVDAGISRPTAANLAKFGQLIAKGPATSSMILDMDVWLRAGVRIHKAT